MELNSIDPFKVEASQELDGVIHRELFRESSADACPNYSSRRQNGLLVAERIEDNYGIAVKLGRLRVKQHKMYFARAGRDKETATEILAVSLSLAICRLAILLLQRANASDNAPSRRGDSSPPPSIPFRGWD